MGEFPSLTRQRMSCERFRTGGRTCRGNPRLTCGRRPLMTRAKYCDRTDNRHGPGGQPGVPSVRRLSEVGSAGVAVTYSRWGRATPVRQVPYCKAGCAVADREHGDGRGEQRRLKWRTYRPTMEILEERNPAGSLLDALFGGVGGLDRVPAPAYHHPDVYGRGPVPLSGDDRTGAVELTSWLGSPTERTGPTGRRESSGVDGARPIDTGRGGSDDLLEAAWGPRAGSTPTPTPDGFASRSAGDPGGFTPPGFGTDAPSSADRPVAESGVSTMMPWVSQVGSCLFPSWGLLYVAGSIASGVSGFHSTIRGHGVAPRPPGSHTTPGAAFVTDSVSDGESSLRSTQAARSPGWLLGSHPTLEPVAR